MPEQNRTEQNRTEQNRTEGLDLYRILAMLMITALHIINQLLCLMNAETPKLLRMAGFAGEYACYCGVNCFALLSGFLLCEKKNTYDENLFRKFFVLYGKICLWGILIYAVTIPLFHIPLSGKTLLFYFFPVTRNWWYINAYFGLLAFLPVLTGFICHCDRKMLLRTGAVFFLIFSILPLISLNEGALNLEGGYSAIWLMICFIWGATLKKSIKQLVTVKNIGLWMFAGAALCVAIPCLIHLSKILQLFHRPGLLFNYISPFCVAEAACLLIFFYRIRIRNSSLKKIISFASRNALGIYLLQCHPVIWEKVICRTDIQLATALLWQIPAWIFGLAAAGILVNWLMEILFCRTGLKKLMEKFSACLCRLMSI